MRVSYLGRDANVNGEYVKADGRAVVVQEDGLLLASRRERMT